MKPDPTPKLTAAEALLRIANRHLQQQQQGQTQQQPPAAMETK